MIGNIFWDYKGDFQWVSVSAFISLLAAIISIVGVVVGAFINRKTQKDIAKQQIDASLKAKARIEWIEKVRENTANLISVLLDLQKNEKDFNLIWENGEKYSEILKLYFSSKINNEIGKDVLIKGNIIVVSDIAKKALFNNESNENKNQYIIEYITCLMKINRNEHYNNTKENLVNFYEIRAKKNREIFEIGKIVSELDIIQDDDGNDQEIYMPKHVNPENENSERYTAIKSELDRLDDLINTFIKKLNFLENSVSEFSSIISLYLKLEWDKAKQGK